MRVGSDQVILLGPRNEFNEISFHFRTCDFRNKVRARILLYFHYFPLKNVGRNIKFQTRFVWGNQRFRWCSLWRFPRLKSSFHQVLSNFLQLRTEATKCGPITWCSLNTDCDCLFDCRLSPSPCRCWPWRWFRLRGGTQFAFLSGSKRPRLEPSVWC